MESEISKRSTVTVKSFANSTNTYSIIVKKLKTFDYAKVQTYLTYFDIYLGFQNPKNPFYHKLITQIDLTTDIVRFFIALLSLIAFRGAYSGDSSHFIKDCLLGHF